MKQIDFEHGRVTQNILQSALPMLAAQTLALLYNIVDRIYIARIPGEGTRALGAVGISFPVIVIITAFANLCGSGGAPLFSIERGRKNREGAAEILEAAFFLISLFSVLLFFLGELLARQILFAFGASEQTIVFAEPYLRIYLTGTFFSLTTTGLNPFINAQGFATTGMTTVMIGTIANIVLDPLFIFVLHMGVEGAAVATVISQGLSCLFVLRFLMGETPEIRLRILRKAAVREACPVMSNIIGLGMAAFVMQLTNSLVTIVANNMLVRLGGDLYVSIMTILNSARQILETPLYSINEGSSPLISYNYGARRPDYMRDVIRVMMIFSGIYCGVVWIFVLFHPEIIIRIFSSDSTIIEESVHAIRVYFSAFIFMLFQYTGQTVFKSLGKKKHAIFFSIFRKGVLVVPLSILLPAVMKMGVDGVFLAEPISNVVGGLACFFTMVLTVRPELKKMNDHKREVE